MESSLNSLTTFLRAARHGGWLLAALLAGAAGTAHAQAASSDVLVSGPAGQIPRAELAVMVADLVPAAERERFWLSHDAVTRMARSLYAQRALAAEALKAGVDQPAEGAAYLRLIRERALSELLMQQRVREATPAMAALDDFARSEYKTKPERFAMPEEVQVRHILLPVARDGADDAQVKAEAEKLAAELRQGADFATLARTRSSDRGSAQRGGDLGFFPRGKMAPEFELAAFALHKPGDISAPIKSSFGYHVIELIARKPAHTRPFDEVLPELREELRNKINGQERRRAWERVESAAQVDAEAVRDLSGQQLRELPPKR